MEVIMKLSLKLSLVAFLSLGVCFGSNDAQISPQNQINKLKAERAIRRRILSYERQFRLKGHKSNKVIARRILKQELRNFKNSFRYKSITLFSKKFSNFLVK